MSRELDVAAPSWRADFPALQHPYLDAAYMHPVSRGGRAAVERYLDFRTQGAGESRYDLVEMREEVLRLYARLIGADAAEVSFVPGTMAGENLIINALRLNRGQGRIVTDSLHFFGSLYLYEQLRARGMEVEILPARGGRIELSDLQAALRRPTDLVALSLVSNYNGFRQDLGAVCGLAHAAGARVYADVIQAAGAVPLDVHVSGVDFCAGGTYKWLMGDFGLGFLYVRRDRQPELDPDMFGYRQLADFRTDPNQALPVCWNRRDDAAGLFMLGTPANSVVAQLAHSLKYIQGIGVEVLAAHRGRLLARLRDGLTGLGHTVMTPTNLGTPILVFTTSDVAATARNLQIAQIFATSYDNRIRVAPSIYNDAEDIDRLLAAVAQSSRASR